MLHNTINVDVMLIWLLIIQTKRPKLIFWYINWIYYVLWILLMLLWSIYIYKTL